MVLLHKFSSVECIKDYMPIALINSIGKLFLKVLANRHNPKLPSLVHKSQSAFICRRTIHDNFKMVQGVARLLHGRRVPSLLFKADMACAFDLVAWSFLLEVLRHNWSPPPKVARLVVHNCLHGE
jgi:hypothetical protein